MKTKIQKNKARLKLKAERWKESNRSIHKEKMKKIERERNIRAGKG